MLEVEGDKKEEKSKKKKCKNSCRVKVRGLCRGRT
jgi:hypothetical protein